MSTRTPRGRARLLALVLTSMVLALQVALGSPATAMPDTCAIPPTPEIINGGFAGVLDPATGHGLAGSVYIDHGYGGQRWNTYDVGQPILGCQDSGAAILTWSGNLMFDGAKDIVAGANGLHWMVYEGGVGTKMDDFIRDGAGASFDGFAVPFLSIALLLAALITFRSVFAGHLAGAARSTGRIIAGLALVGASAFSPLLYTHLYDDVILDNVKQVQGAIDAKLYPGQDMVYRNILPTKLHEEIVFRNFLRGEFGDPDSALAKELGAKLVDAQACTWLESTNATCNKDAKEQAFRDIAQQVKDHGDYSTFTGESGRPGAGFTALLEALALGLFQMLSKAAVLLGTLIVRFVVLAGPIIGLLCFMPGVARRVFRATAGAALITVAMTAAAGLHAFLAIRILDSSMDQATKLLLVCLLSVVAWVVCRPVKRLIGMATAALEITPGGAGGAHFLARMMRRHYDERWMRRLYKKKRKKSSMDLDYWRGAERYPTYDESAPERIPVRAEATRGDRTPHDARGLDNVSQPMVLHRGQGSGPDGAFRRPGDDPSGTPGGSGGRPGAGRGGGGAAVLIHVPEAERLDRETPAGPPADPRRRADGGPSRRALPAPEHRQSPRDEHTAGDTEHDVVIPSEMDNGTSPGPRRAESYRADDGGEVFNVYRPDSGQIEPAPRRPDELPPRPEGQNTDQAPPAEQTESAAPEGETDADSH